MRILAALLLAWTLRAEIVPSTNRVDWIPNDTIGIPGGIPASHHRTNIFLAGGDRTGVANVHTLVQSIIDSLSPDENNRWDIYFPTGSYRLGGPLTLRSYIQIVGDDPLGTNKQSFLINGMTNDNWMFLFGNYNFAAPNAIVSGSTRASSTITVDSSAGLTAGKPARISCLNPMHHVGGFEVIDYSNYRRIYQQMVTIVAINGDEVEIYPPLMSDFPQEAAPWLEEVAGDDRDVGFANISVLHTSPVDDYTGSVGFTWLYSGVQRCWWTNVCNTGNESYGWNVGRSVFTEWQKVVSRHALVEGGANNASLILANDNSGFWVNDSWFENGPPGIEYQRSSFGAFSYNYFTNCISADPYMGNGIHNHGPHSAFVLSEGNDIERQEINDGYFGSAGPHVNLRNRVRGNQEGRTWFRTCYNVGRHTEHFYSIGDILGSASLSYDKFKHDDLFYDPGEPDIVRLHWPNVGNNTATGEETPAADFRHAAATSVADGEAGRPVKVFILTNSGTGHTIPGLMTNLKAGEVIGIQKGSGNTNFWYPYFDGNTNYVAIEDGTDRVTLTNNVDGGGHAFLSWTNGDVLFRIGRDSYGMRTVHNLPKVHIHGSFNYFNNGQTWDESIADHDIPSSFLFASKPLSFWPSGKQWPLDPEDPEAAITLPIFDAVRGIESGGGDPISSPSRTAAQAVNLQSVRIQ